MTENGKKILDICLARVAAGYQLRQSDLGVCEDDEVYVSQDNCVCAVGAVVLGSITWCETAYDMAAEIIGATPDYIKGIAVGFDEMNMEDMSDYAPESNEECLAGVRDGLEILDALTEQGIEVMSQSAAEMRERMAN